MHDCAALGHVMVDGDPFCLVCDAVLTLLDQQVCEHVHRHPRIDLGELQDQRDIARPGEW